MAVRQVVFGDAAREALMRGIDLLTDAVATTLGPGGRTVTLDQGHGMPRLTKDGVTVARAMAAPDPAAELGLAVVREAAVRTADTAGDGTTTATVLARAILHEGLKAVVAGMAPVELKRGLDLALPRVVARLRGMATPVTSDERIRQVGTLSANGNATVGALIVEAMATVGREGLIAVEDGEGLHTVLETAEGMVLPRGYLSPHFINDADKRRVAYDHPLFLLTTERITEAHDLVPALEAAMQQQQPLVIVADDIAGDALATLVVNRRRADMQVTALKAPGHGDTKLGQLQDLVALTGATLIAPDLGHSLRTVTGEHLGAARRVVQSYEQTTLLGGEGAKPVVAARVAELKAQRETLESDFERQRLDERIGRLEGGAAVLRVGGATEPEVREQRDLIDDALNATRAAVAEGVVPGGGVALARAATALEGVTGATRDQTLAVALLQRALWAPLRRIAANAGHDAGLVAARVAEAADAGTGFDAATGVYGDMAERGLLDPVKVVRLAVENAVSTAGTLLTTEALLATPDPAEEADEAEEDGF